MYHGLEGEILADLPEEPCLQDVNVSLQGERMDRSILHELIRYAIHLATLEVGEFLHRYVKKFCDEAIACYIPFSLPQASRISSLWPKALKRRKPSPAEPKPEPGVVTMLARSSMSSKDCQDVFPLTRAQM